MSELPSSPSTRRTLAARLPGPLGRIAESLRKAIERGDARLGLLVGIPVAFLVAWAFAAQWGRARWFDSGVLDVAFKQRPPIAESDRILMIDQNEETFKLLRFPIKRTQYAGVLLALHRLGVRWTVFDVQFKTVAPRPDEMDVETGEYVLLQEDRAFRDALAAVRQVTLAYHFDLDPIAADLAGALPRLAEALSKKFTSSADDLARASGLSADRIRFEEQTIFQLAAQSMVRERLEKNSGLTFADLRKELLPGDEVARNKDKAKFLQHAYWVERGIREVVGRTSPVDRASWPPGVIQPGGLVPPFYPFLQGVESVAAVNANADPDGVLRRPWAGIPFRGRPHLYLGVEGALRGMAAGGETLETTISEREFRVAVRDGREGPVRRVVSIPLDEEGRVLVDWAGNAQHRRGMPEPYFQHLPFHDLLSFFEERYLYMDANFRRVLASVSESSGEPYHPEYGPLSARLSDFLSGKGTVPPSDVAGIESKMDEIRRKVLVELEEEVAGIRKVLPTISAQRARESAEKEIVRLTGLTASLRGAYDREAELRPKVEGRIAWIGSASTAGGDNHSTPLGITTPGVDVLANVANMVLTGQALRRVPAWVDFSYVLAVGVLVCLAVTHWNTMTGGLPSALLLTAASFAVYAGLFVGPSILISGAGPAVQSAVCFALVAGFKELVTNRSRRKLQRELERNTSPEMVKILMEHPEFLSKPRKMVGTFFFTDVKGFTSISEKMTPEVLFPFINRMLDASTQALKAHQAYIDKYVGDGVVALFGMPVPSADHARNACLAALDCQIRLKALNEEFARESLPQVRVRIGVNSGDVNAGNMGAADRSSYTAMGDPINLASRLEGANKSYDTYIMIGESTLELVRGQFVVRELDRIRVVGKKLPVSVYELIAVAGEPVPFPPTFLERYDAALKLFQARHWQESIDAFEALLKLKPGDKPCENYVARAGDFLLHPPPADQEIVFELHSK